MNNTNIAKGQSTDYFVLIGLIPQNATVALSLLIFISFIRNPKGLKNFSNFIWAILIFIVFKNNSILIIKQIFKPYIGVGTKHVLNCFIYLNNSIHFNLILALFVHIYRLIKHPFDGNEKISINKKKAIGILLAVNILVWSLYCIVIYVNLIKEQAYKNIFKDILQTLFIRIPLILSFMTMVRLLFIVKKMDAKKSSSRSLKSTKERKEKKFVINLSVICGYSLILWFYFVFLEPFVTFKVFYINSSIFYCILDYYSLIEMIFLLLLNNNIRLFFLKTYSFSKIKNQKDAKNQIFYCLKYE